MQLVLVAFFLHIGLGCATSPKDFLDTKIDSDQARVVVYRPHRVPNMWAEYLVSVNGTPLSIVKNEGYITTNVSPGLVKISSRHTQDKRAVEIELTAEKGQTLFVKIDPDINITLLDVTGEILKVATLTASVGAKARLDEGTATTNDALTLIRAERVKHRMHEAANDEKKHLGYHKLIQLSPVAGLKEVKECCSSKKTSAIK
jgi:hypothetical protein